MEKKKIRTEGLIKHSQEVNQETREKVLKALSQLRRSNKKITVAAVAKKAGVGVSTLYTDTNAPLLERINQAKLIISEEDKPKQKVVDIKTQSLLEKNVKLKAELERLKVDNADLLAQLVAKTTENMQLKQSLSLRPSNVMQLPTKPE